MTHLQLAFWFLAAIAAGGVFIAALVGMKIRFPSILGMGHGLGALAALGFLFYVNLTGGDATPTRAWWAFAIFAAGFTGGVLLFRVLFKNAATLPLALVHGSAGALGLYVLYGAAF